METEQENQEKVENQKQGLMKYSEVHTWIWWIFVNDMFRIVICTWFDHLNRIQEKNNEILHYNNQLAGLQTRLDKAQSEAVKWESDWTRIKNTAATKTLLLGRTKM